MNTLAIAGSLLSGGLIGILLMSLLFMSKRSADPERDAFEMGDDVRFRYLERTECNLMFNPQFDLWALIDADNKPIAAGKTARAAIDRAMEREHNESAADAGVPA